MQMLWLLPTLAMSVMFATRSGSMPIAALSVLAVSLQLFVMLRKSSQLVDPPNQVAIAGGRVFVDGKKLPRSSWLWGRGSKVAVHKYLSELPDARVDTDLLNAALARGLRCRSESGDCWLGVTDSGEFEVSLASWVHCLIIGPTGSGKSQLLRLLLDSLHANNTDEEVQSVLIDFKGSALLKTLRRPERFQMVVDDLDQTLHAYVWDFLSQELVDRERLLRDARGEVSLTRLIVVVDELAAVLKTPRAAEVLGSVATRGRSLAMTLLLANQSTSGIPRELMLNLRTKIALQSIDQVELVQLGGSSRKIKVAQAGWIAARAIRNDTEEVDFRFPNLALFANQSEH